MSRISEFARKHKLPLVVACKGDIEGEGILYAINKNGATVRYDGKDKKYKFPEELDDFVLVDNFWDGRMRRPFIKWFPTENPKFFLPNDDYGKDYLKTEHFKSLRDSELKLLLKKEFPVSKKKERKTSRYEGENIVFSHNLFGTGAGDIEFSDPRDFIVSLAYLAVPGRCSLIADVPPNHYEEFDEKFPYAHYGHTESHNGSSCQFTISVHNSTNMPSYLVGAVMPSDASKIGGDESIRIIRSAFCYDLVDNRGFMFGKEQDIEAIRNTIPNEYKEIFDTHYEDFCKEMGVELDSCFYER